MERPSFVSADGYTSLFYHETSISAEKYFESHPPFRHALERKGRKQPFRLCHAGNHAGGYFRNRKYHRRFHCRRPRRPGRHFLVLGNRNFGYGYRLHGMLFKRPFPEKGGKRRLSGRPDVRVGKGPAHALCGKILRFPDAGRRLWRGVHHPVQLHHPDHHLKFRLKSPHCGICRRNCSPRSMPAHSVCWQVL